MSEAPGPRGWPVTPPGDTGGTVLPVAGPTPWYSSPWARFALATAIAAVISTVFLAAVITGRLGADPVSGRSLLAGEVRGAAVVDACSPAKPLPDSISDRTIRVGGLDRTYRLHLPRGYDGTEKVPLVLLFHGTSGTISSFEEYTRFPDAAVERGYAVATLQAVGQESAGVPAHWTVPGFPGPDDVAFSEAVVREAEAEGCVDPRRVYATGLSSGAAFSAYLACESPMVAAIAPVAGVNLVRPCASGPPVSVLSIHGTGDPIVPYDGVGDELAEVDKDYFNSAVTAAQAAWAARDGCARQEQARLAVDIVVDSSLSCADGAEVTLYTVENGGHTWPGTEPRPDSAVGLTTASVSANDAVLSFFDRHELSVAAYAALPKGPVSPSTSATPDDSGAPSDGATPTDSTTPSDGATAPPTDGASADPTGDVADFG